MKNRKFGRYVSRMRGVSNLKDEVKPLESKPSQKTPAEKIVSSKEIQKGLKKATSLSLDHGFEMGHKAAASLTGGGIRTAGSVSTGGGIRTAGSVSTGGGIQTAGSVSTGGGLFDTIPEYVNNYLPRMPFEFMNHKHAHDFIHDLTDYGYKHIQSAAATIIGKHNVNDHHPILHHRFMQSAPTGKYLRIMNHDRDRLSNKMQTDHELRDALANSVHAAHTGGYLDFRNVHYKHIAGSVGDDDQEQPKLENFGPRRDRGLLGIATQFAMGKPEKKQDAVELSRDQFDQVNWDKMAQSPQDFMKGALHGYSGNWYAQSAYAEDSAANIGFVAKEPLNTVGTVQRFVGSKISDLANLI